MIAELQIKLRALEYAMNGRKDEIDPLEVTQAGAIKRGLAAGEPDMEAIAAKAAAEYPIFNSSRRRGQ